MKRGKSVPRALCTITVHNSLLILYRPLRSPSRPSISSVVPSDFLYHPKPSINMAEDKLQTFEIPKTCKAGVVVNEGPDFRVEVQDVPVPEIGRSPVVQFAQFAQQGR